MVTFITPSSPYRAEESLADHPSFGDSAVILDRRQELYEFALEILARRLSGVTSAATAIGELRAPERAAVLDDPVIRVHIHEALGRLQRDELGSPDYLERFFAQLDAEGWHAAHGAPLECAIPQARRLGDDDAWVWEPAQNDSAIVRNFEARFSHEFLEHHDRTQSARDGGLLLGDEHLARLLDDGYELLCHLLPRLAASVLAHVRLVAFMRVQTPDAAVQSGSIRAIPGAIFLSPRHLQTPWAVAEALLHECAHNKLFDLYLTRLILEDGYDCRHARTIHARWNKSTLMQLNQWPLDQALSACHVYVHLAVFDRAVREHGQGLVERFGPVDTSSVMKSPRALERAAYLVGELADHEYSGLGPDGRALVDWLAAELGDYPVLSDGRNET
jgi:HEXXH motif-containing protein